MILRRLLVLLAIPVLSAACCCGPAPTDPEESFVGAWELVEGRVPTASALGELEDVVLVLVSHREVDGHSLSGRSVATGAEVTAGVRFLSPDPRLVALRIEREAPEGAPEEGFVVSAGGPSTGDGELHLSFAAQGTGVLGSGVFRRR